MHPPDLQGQRETCAYCPKLCRHVCPAALAEPSEAATPTYKQQVAYRARAGEPLDPERARALYKCTDCLATVPACRHRIPVADSLRAARAQAVASGVAPPEVERVRRRFARHGSPYELDLAGRLDAILPGARTDRADTALLPSCTMLARVPGELDAASRLFTALDGRAPAVALPNPACCGYPLDTLGLDDALLPHARRVAVALSGFRRVIAPGAACAWMLAVRYRELGIELACEVVPLVDALADRADEIAARRREGEPPAVAYHDPCFLGRRLGRYEQPRTALRAALGRDALDLPCSRAESLCSGGGGGYPLTHPHEAGTCASRVVEGFRATGAQVLVTGCPSARRLLTRSEPGIEVRGVAEAIVARLEPRSIPPPGV